MTVSCLQGCIIPGIHADPERVTLILSLCQGVFMNQFIFRHILGHIFPQKKRISTIRGRRYQKGKLNAKKNIIFRSVSFADLFVEFKLFSIHAKTVLKINWSVKMPWHERILKFFSIVLIAMETLKMSNFTCQSKSFISIFFTCQVSACELQPFSCQWFGKSHILTNYQNCVQPP